MFAAPAATLNPNVRATGSTIASGRYVALLSRCGPVSSLAAYTPSAKNLAPWNEPPAVVLTSLSSTCIRRKVAFVVPAGGLCTSNTPVKALICERGPSRPCPPLKPELYTSRHPVPSRPPVLGVQVPQTANVFCPTQHARLTNDQPICWKRPLCRRYMFIASPGVPLFAHNSPAFPMLQV